MQPCDRAPFADLLAEVMAYYGRDVSPFVLDVFWSGLARHEFTDVNRAFSLHARDPDHGQYPPRVADITRMLEGATQTQGMRAWVTVEFACRSIGQYRTVAFDDPLIHVVVDEMGGWMSLCQSKIDDLPFRAREFERRYASYRLRREVPAFAPYLIGALDAQNQLDGYPVDIRPVLIGDPTRAAQVIARGREGAKLRITQAGTIAQRELASITASDDAA